MSDKKGFTLVELLAVIVILAIIMIIAIPAVLSTMEQARRETFKEFIDKVAITTQKKYASQELMGENVGGNIVYDITKDLNMSSTGDFKGYSLITTEKDIYITLYSRNYAVTGLKYGNINDSNILNVDATPSEDLTVDYLVKSTGDPKYSYYDNGVLRSGEVTLTKAILKSGVHINSQMKKLAGNPSAASDTTDTTIKHFVYTRDLSKAPDTKVNVATDNSEEPVYIWWDEGTKTIYMGCKNNQVYLSKSAGFQFNKLKAVEDIDVSHFISDEAESFYRYFGECESLQSIDVTHFKTSKSTNFRAMFQHLYKVTSLDVSNFDTSNATDMGYMFTAVPVTTLNLSKFNTSKVTDMEHMLSYTKVKEYHLESFDTGNLRKMDGMFSYVLNLEKIYVSNKFVITSATSVNSVFLGCTKLQNYDANQVKKEDYTRYVTVV